MEPQIITQPLAEPNIGNGTKALEEMKFSEAKFCYLMRFKSKQEEHLFWVANIENHFKMKQVFAFDYIPDNITKFQISLLLPESFFTYRKELYFLTLQKDALLLTKVAVYNIWKELDILYNIQDGIHYISKAFRITDKRTNARELIGYCWRTVTEQYMYTLPFFMSDYKKIIQIPYTELDFEWLETGEKFFYKNILWTVHQQGKNQFFANPSSMFLKK